MKNSTPRFSKLLCTGMLIILGITAEAQPNNNCANATPLTVGAACTNGTNVGATVEAGETTGATGTGCWASAPNNTVWYTFTTGTAGNYTVSTDNGGTTDTEIKILSGTCGAFTSVACNEDAGAANAFAAIASASLPAATTYYVQVDVFGGGTGAFCINVTYNPPIANDCIFSAIDITPQINGINPATNPFDCAQYTYAAGGSAPTTDMVNGNSMSCDPGPDFRDIWFSFTVTASTPDVWIDVYQLVGTTPDYTAAIYSGTPAGICGGTITGLTTIDCSDGASAGGTLDVGVCTTPIHPRINVSTLAPGTYYYRVWEWGGGTPSNGTINLCVETSSPVGITSDACPSGPTMGFGCGTAPNVNINETYTNLSNAGCLGNACNTSINEPQLAVGGAGQIHNNCAGPWLTSVGYLNNVMNNSAIYAFNVNSSGTCQANVTIQFNNIEYAGTTGNVMQVQVMSGTCAGGTNAVMAGTTSDPCFEMRPASGTLPNGTYYIVVDGQDGQLMEYDLNLQITYGGIGCTPTTPPAAPTAVNGSRCGPGTVTLSATGCAGGTIKWYAAATGGTSLFTGASFTTPSISTTTVYYASCTVSGCEGPRVAVTATVTNPATATFSYTASPYCQNAANPLPTMGSGSVAGTFSAGSGLVFVSASTGEINLAASTAGTYTVTNTIPAASGCPTVTATSSVTITSMPVAGFSYAASPYCQNAANPSPTFVSGGSAGTFSAGLGLVFVSSSTGQINLAASTPGTYTVTNSFAASGGCPAVSATASITITPLPVATFSYPASPYCQSAANPTPVFTGGGTAGTFSAGTGLVFVSNATGEIDLAASTAGTYTVTNTIAAANGCPVVTATSSITITPLPVAGFSYTASPYCQNASNPSPTFVSGGSAGTFSAGLGLVFVSTSTGQINLAASTPGTYTVTNSFPASGGCPAVSATASITITPLPVATFSYPASPYCQSAANPTPVFTGGGTAGTFSAGIGLVFVSTATGEINLAASTAGTYTVTNTIAASGGCPAVTATSNITISPAPTAGFSYTGTPYCQTGANPSPTMNAGATAGTFTAGPGLFINATTGEVNLASSTPGTYTVTNTVAASGGCPSTFSTATITITAPQTATFTYTGSPYCQSGTDPSPTFTSGGVAGTFSSTGAVVFISTSTGQIDLSATAPGTYTITNTIAANGGCPSTSANNTITINSAPVGTFSYTPGTYCQDAANPSPVFSGGGIAGTFTGGTGLVIGSTSGTVDLAASAAGTYTVTNTLPASGGCPSSTSTANITITPVESSAFSYSSSTFCQTGTNPSPTITGVTGGDFTFSPSGIIIDPSTGLINLAGSTLGTYAITYTTTGSCPSATTINVTITNSPAATFSYTASPYCQSGANPTPTFSGGGTAGIFSASSPNLGFVSTATGEIDLANSIAGTYTVTNTIPASGGCSSATANATITIDAAPSASFTYAGSPYCIGAANPSPVFSGSGVAGTFSSSLGLNFVSTSTGEINLATSTAGTYTVTNTVPATASCPATSATATITITAPQPGNFSYTSSPYCQNAANPSATIAAGSVAGTFTAPAGLNIINSSTGEVDLFSSTPATYTVTNTIAANGGCPSATFTNTITINPVQTSGFSYSSSTYCQSGSDPTPTITGTLGGLFTFSPPGLSIDANTGTIDVSASNPNTYTITYTTGGPCASSSSNSVTITSPSPVDIVYTGSPYCPNGTNPVPTITGTGGVTSSSMGLTFVSTTTGEIDLAASTPGSYNVVINFPASGGCAASSDSASIVINPLDDASFNYSSTTFCASGTNPIPAITGISGGLFTSSGGVNFISATTGEIDLSTTAPNTYVITYTTPGPCQNSSSQTITITNAPSTSFSYASPSYCQDGVDPSPILAPGSTAGAFAGGVGLTFTGTSGQIDLSASTPGTYTVTNTLSASGGCAASTSSTTVTILAPDNASFNYSSSTFCQSGPNPIPSITGVPSGFFSAGSGLNFVSSSTGEIDLSTSTPNTYTITYTTPGPCVNTSTQTITITNTPTTGFSYTASPYCQTGTDPLPVFSPGASSGTFSGSSPSLVINASTGQVDLSASAPGTYTVTNSIIASGGCPASSSTATIQITAPGSASFNYPATSYCQSSPDPSPVFTGGGVAGTFTSTGVVFVSSATGQIDVSATMPGTYSVTNTIPASGGCPAVSSTTNVTISGPQNAAFSYSSSSFCQTAGNASPIITGVTGGTFSSIPSTGIVIDAATGVITTSSSSLGTYAITYNTPGPCPNSSTINITINAAPVAAATGDVVCEGETIQLTASGGGTYSWSGPGLSGATSQNPTIPNSSLSDAGAYTVTVTNGGCSDTETVPVVVNALPAATAGPDVTIMLGTSTPLLANGGSTYSWSPSTDLSCSNCPNPIASPDVTTDYCVTVTQSGCSSTECVKVTVQFDCPVNKELGVPNAFSPNEDGINDFFCLQGWNYCMADFSIMIFDRWGEKVYEVNEADECWDGTYRGKRLDPGVFVYFIKAVTKDGVLLEKKGNISLIR